MDLIVFQVPFIRIQADLQGEDLLVVDEESISSTCVQLKHWTTSTLYQHVAFLSSDHVMFHISGNESKLAMTALMVDLSRDTYGSTVNLSDTYQHLPYVITVFDSAHNDVLMGNALGNFLSCSGGTDHLEGAGGSDKYVIKSGCKKAYISNFAEDHVSDVLFLEHPFLKITVTYQWPNVVLKVDDTNVEVHIQNWLKGKEFQHLLLQTIDGVISMLPSNSSEPEVITPIEINLSQENCTENKKTFDLSEDPFGKVERFQAKSSSCSYSVIGNSLDNYIDPGIGNAMKYQYLMGGNGSDTYVLGHGYGYENEIDNGAIDMKTDYLFLDVLYKDITVQLNKPNITLLSTSRNDSVRVRLLRYLQGPEHQHLVIKSSDGYLFKVNPLFDPYKSVISIDTSTSTKSCNISCAMGEEFLQVTHIYGASQFSNYITGSKSSSVIKGGNKNDHLEGNEGNDRIEGGAGDDIIIGNGGEDVLLGGEGDDELKGGAGNDLIYGGRGSDKVDGGPGYDTLFFSGDVRTSTGVKVDLISGRGEWADAEGDTYTDVESVSGTNYNDVLIGDDEDNELEGKFGNDTLIPGQGSDLLFGGPGNDLYILDDCSGVKHINNFASDEAQDYILIRNFSFSDACYFLLEGNLVISFSYNDSLLSLIQQNNLVIFLENWNKNDSSYQHVDFVFANDTLVSGFVFTSAPEIRPTLSKLNSTNPILSVREASETSVEIEITTSSWLNYKEYTEDTELKFYLEVSDDLFFTDSVHWEHQTSIHISGLLSGVLYTFQLYVTQCEFPLLVIAETTQRTIPTAPTSVNVTHISHSNAFITWTAPSSNTDPNSRKYTYVVDVKDGDITVTQITTNLTSAEVTGLKPKTVYTFSVLSDIEGMKSQEVTIHKETPNLCPTFSVPEGTRLLDEEMTDNGPVAVLECEKGFQQISNLEILCLEEISSSPCAPKSCTYEGSVFPHEFSVQNECFLYKISSKCLFGNFQPPIPKCCPNPSGVVMIKPYGIHIYVHTIRLPSRYQHSVTFFCPSGYKLSGPSELDCDLRTGQWSEDHLPSCYQVHCPDPPQDPHGTFPALSRHSGPFTEGNTLELECSDMYHPSPKDRITCRDGDWESSSCEPNAHLTETYSQDYKLYGKLEQWMSGTWTRYITSNAEFLARFCCENRGLDFVGISGGLVECSELKLETHGSKYEGKAVASQGNGWENVCIEDITAARSFCGIIFPNQDGNVSLPTTMFFSVYTYKCNFSGCSLQRREQTCTKRVRCRAICDPLTIPNGQNCDRSLEGQNCSISCNRLHRLEGSSSIQCTSNGWSEKPYCVETEDCGYDYERGPHSLSCLTKLWTEVGCSVEAPLSPTKDPHHWDFLQSWTVAEVRRRMAEFRRDGEATCNPDYQEEKCFPGRATVLTSEGNRKSMAELRVGDKVLALNADGELVFSEVILWLDRRPSAVERYVLLTTEDFSEPLSMSADHVTFIARSNGTAASVHTMIPVFAKDLQPGHLIHRYDPATGLLVSRRITNVQESMDLGAYAPLTVEGNLIVDGHLVSCYALQCLQYFAHLPFAPYRFLHTMRSFSPLFENLFPVQREEEDEGMHWYAIAWYQVGQWFGYPFGKTCYPRELQLYHYP
ncbi:uncharacterized protein [Hoplias malabaricus]|uniref:uncharacterized protein n=1 Tax=Hoplias malabaricus TaxID=27720 RepID=UPI003461B843